MLRSSTTALVKQVVVVHAGKAALLAVLACASIAGLTASVPPARSAVDPPRWPFTVSGVLTRVLAPDVASPVEVILTNPHQVALTVTRLTVQIAEIRASPGRRPCLPTNFRVSQFSGRYGFAIAARGTTSLTELGIAEGDWPRLTMLDLSFNQDACKGVGLTLRITGEAHR